MFDECAMMRNLLSEGAYLSWVQGVIDEICQKKPCDSPNYLSEHIAPAQYWHDPINVETYRDVSKYLALINNEENMHKSSLQSDLSELSNFVMAAWRNETFIKPMVGRYLFAVR